MNIEQIWKDFINSMRILFSDLPVHRPLNQFLGVRNTALNLAETPEMLQGLSAGYKDMIENKTDKEPTPLFKSIADAVVDEWKAFTNAVTEWQGEVKANLAKAGITAALLNAGKTVVESTKEIFERFLPSSPWVASILTLLKESFDFFS